MYRVKQYIKANENSSGSIYRICERLDEDGDGFLTDLEFEVALEKTKVGFSIKQLQGLYEHIVREPKNNLIDYMACIKGICGAEYAHEEHVGNKVLIPKATRSNERLSTHLQLTLHKKMNVFDDELLHYKIDPSADYFDEFHPKCTTILTNQEAAIKRCC